MFSQRALSMLCVLFFAQNASAASTCKWFKDGIPADVVYNKKQVLIAGEAYGSKKKSTQPLTQLTVDAANCQVPNYVNSNPKWLEETIHSGAFKGKTAKNYVAHLKKWLELSKKRAAFHKRIATHVHKACIDNSKPSNDVMGPRAFYKEFGRAASPTARELFSKAQKSPCLYVGDVIQNKAQQYAGGLPHLGPSPAWIPKGKEMKAEAYRVHLKRLVKQHELDGYLQARSKCQSALSKIRKVKITKASIPHEQVDWAAIAYHVWLMTMDRMATYRGYWCGRYPPNQKHFSHVAPWYQLQNAEQTVYDQLNQDQVVFLDPTTRVFKDDMLKLYWLSVNAAYCPGYRPEDSNGDWTDVRSCFKITLPDAIRQYTHSGVITGPKNCFKTRFSSWVERDPNSKERWNTGEIHLIKPEDIATDRYIKNARIPALKGANSCAKVLDLEQEFFATKQSVFEQAFAGESDKTALQKYQSASLSRSADAIVAKSALERANALAKLNTLAHAAFAISLREHKNGLGGFDGAIGPIHLPDTRRPRIIKGRRIPIPKWAADPVLLVEYFSSSAKNVVYSNPQGQLSTPSLIAELTAHETKIKQQSKSLKKEQSQRYRELLERQRKSNKKYVSPKRKTDRSKCICRCYYNSSITYPLKPGLYSCPNDKMYGCDYDARAKKRMARMNLWVKECP